jgi:hypothetical protein
MPDEEWIKTLEDGRKVKFIYQAAVDLRDRWRFPKVIAPFIPIPNNISVVATAIMDPTMRLPVTKPRIISFRLVMKRAVSIFELKRASPRGAV